MSDDKKAPPSKAEAKTSAAPAAQVPAAPAAAPAPAEAPTPPKRMHLPANLFKNDEHSCRRFHAVAPSEHTFQDVIDPNYLKHVNITRMQRHDRVIIDHAEGLFSVELYIWDADRETGKLAFFIDQMHDRTQQEIVRDDLSGAKIEQRGSTFAVEIDNKPAKAGFPTRKMAEAWLDMKRGGTK
jgi:hypothetical protein